VARLVLVGLPGVGKTTLARGLGEYWRCTTLDTDDLIAEKVGMSAARYLRDNGEVAFRQRELEALRQALESDAVVATGAGVVTTSSARELLEGEITFWLDCDDETLVRRVGDGDRPLLGEDHSHAIAVLREQREDWYRSSARLRVDASGSPDEVRKRVIDEIEHVSP
jgi:shikimate kinase